MELAVIILCFFVVFIILWRSNPFIKKKHKPKVVASVLLEKINTICKLSTVQGSFKEIVNYQDSKRFIKLIPFEKKAIILVDAIAHVGFDLNKMELHVDKTKKQIVIDVFPEPEIISIDTDIKYYDIQYSRFNKFSSHNYTELNQLAKENVSKKIEESNLYYLAQQQVKEALDLVEYLAESMGWHLHINCIEQGQEQKKLKKSIER